MSTEIAIIKGQFEKNEDPKTFTVEYGPSELFLKRFSGGPRGKMLLMSIEQEDGETAYVQLTRDQVRDMIVKLKKAFEIGSWKL